VRQKQGLLETADGGTVFLDEIGELPMAIQVKLLRVLEDRRVLRVGGLSARVIDVRFVSATHRDLPAEVEAGRFRQDLYFRLNGITLHVPPLRARPYEIEPLARELARDKELTTEAIAALRAHAWPGNVRELRNVVERAVVLAGDGPIEPRHLRLEKVARSSLKDEKDALEQKRILDALATCGGNQTQAAKMLGIARGTLVARLERYDVTRPRKPKT